MTNRIQRSSISKAPKHIIKPKELERIDIQKIILSQQKFKSTRKYRLSSKNPLPTTKPTIEQDYSLDKKSSGPRIRFKTQADESKRTISHRNGQLNERFSYQKLINLKRKRINQFKQQILIKKDIDQRYKQYESSITNNRINKKRTFFLGDLNIKSLNKRTKQLCDSPLTGKNALSKNKSENRENKKNNYLEKYISQSLQKCDVIQLRNRLEKKDRNNKKKQDYQTQKVNQNNDQQQSTHVDLRSKSNIYYQSEKNKTLQPILFEKKKNNFDLSKQQLNTFGDRFPDSFQKIKLLGRGGFSLVWLGQHKNSKKQFAVKQIITQNNHQTHIKQIWFGTYFFQMGGFPKKQFSQHIGIQNLVKIYSYYINKKDTWIFYEKCGQSLGNALHQLKGQTINNQRCYRAIYKPFYNHIRNNQNQIRRIIIEVAKALILLSQNKIVHSDLKTQNILVKVNQKDIYKVQQVKLIDYGSSFCFGHLQQFSMATPEYMAPQILNYILFQNQQQYAPKLLDHLNNYNNPWVIDVWSLGCVILEIVSGIPLWMSLPTLVRRNNVQCVRYGLFAIKGRVFDKIIKKQIQIVQNLNIILSQQNYSGIELQDDLELVMRKMLTIDPSQRISPQQIVNILSQNLK